MNSLDIFAQLSTFISIITTEASTFDFELASHETYDFYVRSLCNNSLEFSDWEGPLAYQYTPPLQCEPPVNITLNDDNPFNIEVTWQFNAPSITIDHFKIRWGNQGFNVNTSTSNETITQTNTYQTEYVNLLNSGAYDFYVQTICNTGETTEWVGPLTYVYDMPPCEAPLGMSFSITYGDDDNGNPTIATYVTSGLNNDSTYRIIFVLEGDGVNGNAVVDSTIVNSYLFITYSLIDGTIYDVYKRKECTPNHVSEWAGPFTLNYY